MEERHEGGRQLTSLAVTTKAFQSILGIIFIKSLGFGSSTAASSSQSRGWRGKDAEELLQVLTAQERKLRVRTFIFCADGFVAREVIARFM